MTVIASDSSDQAPTSNEDKVIQATLRCVARWGVGKTTLDDIAGEAGVSRATVYRAFPGGKDVLLASVLRHELSVFFAQTAERFDACGSLAELLAAGVFETHAFVHGHGALGYLLEHEADLVLVDLAMNRLDPVIAVAAMFVAPHVARFVGIEAATEHANWLVRNVISYTLNPSPKHDFSARTDVERFVSTYFLPVLAGPDHRPQP